MGVGRIKYYPPATRSLTFPEDKYCELASDPVFNAGVGDFGLFGIFQVASTIASPTNTKLLAGKGPFDLSSLAGWWSGVIPSSKKVVVTVNDGNASQLQIESDADAFVLDEAYWLARLFDRDANLSLWLGRFSTGVLTLIKTASISSRPGSWSNTNALWLGNWGATADRYLKGYQADLRLDLGRLLPASEIAKEWDRVRYGAPRNPDADYTGRWEFNGSLIDASGAYELSYLPSGTPVYADGYPPQIPITYDFPATENYSFDFEEGFTETDDIQMADDGTTDAAKGPTKKEMTLPFKYIGDTQLEVLWAAWDGGQAADFYKDKDLPRTMRAQILRPPRFRKNFHNNWSGDLEVRQV